MHRLCVLLALLAALTLGACATTPAAPPPIAPPQAPRPVLEPGIYRLSDGARLSPNELFKALEGERVVFVGESHDNADHHEVQRLVLEGLSRRNPGAVALGMEMFQAPYQAPLDAYTRQELDEAQMLAQTQYADRWGFDFGFYRPMVELMRLQGSHVVALNAPKELTRRISKVGLGGLTEAERAQLPPSQEAASPEHRQMIQGAFSSFHSDMDEDTFERFYQAQVTWDATMAASCVEFLQTHPETQQMVVIAGMFHVHYGLGIPHHVQELAPDWPTAILIPATNQEDEPLVWEDLQASGLGDYVWVLR